MPTHQTWAKFFKGLIDGREMAKMRDRTKRLRIPRQAQVWMGAAVCMLDQWCLDYSEDGMLPSNKEDIARIAGFLGSGKAAELFTDALIAAGFVDVVGV